MTPSSPSQSGRLHWLRATLELLLPLFLFHYLWTRREELTPLVDLGPWALWSLVTLFAAGALVGTWDLMLGLYHMRKPIRFGEAFVLVQATSMMSWLPMGISTVLRARILKHHYRVEYTEFVSFLGAFSLVNIATASVLGLGILFLVGPKWHGEGALLLGGFFLLGLVGSWTVLTLPVGAPPSGRLRFVVHQVREGCRNLARSAGAGWGLAWLGVLKIVPMAVRLWICFQVVSTPVTMADASLFALASYISMMVPGVARTLGVKELITGAAAMLAGVPFDAAILASSLDRGVSLACLAALGLPSLILLRSTHGLGISGRKVPVTL